ncbi:MAG: class I SAM-dependent methyltransferase [Actinomycetota bacterium]|nr:class I SAM-dependent methyltransferase [Actinomycetota bacterium]
MKADELACVCGARDYHRVLDGTYSRVGYSGYRFRILQCNACKLARTDPMPDVEQYTKDEYAEDKPFAQGTTDLWSESIAAHIARLTKPGKLLDIGSHSGNLHPPLTKRGFDVLGVDIDPAAVEVAKQAGRQVLLTDLFEAGFSGASFDVVTMIHTLEHLDEPKKVLAEIARLLRPGGILFINVPNYRGWLPRIMKDHWIGWVAPQHVWQFEPRTLEGTVRRAGPFDTAYLRGVGSMEPPSQGIKGLVKKLVAGAGDRFGGGDQVVAAFHRRPDSFTSNGEAGR